VLRYTPREWRAHLQRGYLWLRRDELDQAFDDFNQVLAILPTLPAALSGRATTRMSKRDFQWAIIDYDQVLRELPDNHNALHDRGTAKVYQRDFNGAQADFERLLRLRPQGSYSHSNLGWLALNRGEYDKAIQYCKRAIEIDPENGAAYYSRGAAKAALQDIRGAVADFKRSLKLWTTVDTPLTAHIGREMRDFLRQHERPTPNDTTTSEATSHGE
jgi:tetratricopeptide (TPR) repeat protein